MKRISLITLLIIACIAKTHSQNGVIDHRCTKISAIPVSAIIAAKQKLHIAYGHTSHGSQLTEGMNGLVQFMNLKAYPHNLFAWNKGGHDDALDLHDYAMKGDAGYFPDWVNNTRGYLGQANPATGKGTGTNEAVNVIIWSWCGQVSGTFTSGKLFDEYLDPMAQLEKEYPGVKFVYMTGHLDHWNDAANKAANQTIRDFCIKNDKILYDFADIECYNPDGHFFEFANDDCSYYKGEKGELQGNWAEEWQDKHKENIDWYNCKSAHSKPLNANLKAYAAWWLWAKLAGWQETEAAPLNE